MKLLIAKANPPVVRDADAAPLFQRGQAKRSVPENRRVATSETADESEINVEYPPLKKGGRGDLLFAGHQSAKPCVTHAAQKIGRS